MIIDSSAELGITGEAVFKKMAEARGMIVTPATKNENMFNHIDYFLDKPGSEQISVDVKGIKKSNRDGKSLIDEMWIEFYNVRGDKGWIHGKANLIAQQVNDNIFYIFDREDLLKQVNKLVKWNLPMVKSPRQALYRLYQRWQRQDVITLVKLKDLKPIRIWE